MNGKTKKRERILTLSDIDRIVECIPKESADDAKRQLREPILKAFDIYKSNVYYGIIKETEAEHTKVMEWYNKLCDLDIQAVENIPVLIKKYIKE